MLNKLDIARALLETGALLEIKGENPWKARAYEKGAAAVEELSEDIGKLIDEKRLTSVRGIGQALAAQIAELATTGRSSVLEKLRSELPPGILALSEVPGLSLKKIRALHDALGISTVEELKQACLTGKVRGVPGFGAKTESSLLQGIYRYETRDERILLVDAMEVAEPLLAYVRASPKVARADLAGSIRRFRETVRGIKIVAASKEPAAVAAHFAASPRVAGVESSAATEDGARSTIRLSGGVRSELVCVKAARYAAALHHFTGSRGHVEKLSGLAVARGLTLTEEGLLRGRRSLRIRTEEDLYGHLGLPYIPPELREDVGEVEAAARGEDWGDLIDLGDIKGLVHCHTVYSDGKNTIEEMAREADAMGMAYLTITDHSPAAHYANGVGHDRLKRQWDEIARVQELVTVKLLRGTESDILETGALDYPDAILEQLDVVIASVHSRMKMDEDQMTKRIVRAMKQPVFKIWGHALGRLIQRRDPFACRVEEVLDVIAESRAAVEVNGDPYRLDMEPRWLREARKRGIRFVISTDAHSTAGLHNLRYGVGIARRGGVRRDETLNALDPDAFQRAVRPAS